MVSLKDRIIAAVDFDTKMVKVDEWNVTVYLKSLSVGDGIKFQVERKALPKDQDERVVSLLLAYTLCDEHGNLIFELPEELDGKNPKVLGRLFYEALKVNGMDEESEEAIEGES